jgi:hypothetical protein
MAHQIDADTAARSQREFGNTFMRMAQAKESTNS